MGAPPDKPQASAAAGPAPRRPRKDLQPIPEAKECSVDPMQHSMKQWGAGEKGRNYCISTPNRELPVVVTCANYNHATYVEYQVFLP